MAVSYEKKLAAIKLNYTAIIMTCANQVMHGTHN